MEANALSLPFYDAVGRDEQIRLGEEAYHARTSGDRWLLGLVTGNYGYLTAKLGEIEKAIELTDEAYRLCRAVGESRSPPWLSNLEGYALEGGNTAEARRRLDESLELARLIDDTRGTRALANLGWVNSSRATSTRVHTSRRRRRSLEAGARRLGAESIWGFSQVQPRAATPTARAPRGGRARAR